MTNHTIDNDRILRDASGKEIGKVDHDGTVRDGYRQRGTVNSDGRYIDEYGRDMGWTVSGGRSSSGGGSSLESGCMALPFIVAIGSFFALKDMTPEKRRKTLIAAAIVLLVNTCCCLVYMGLSDVLR